MKINQQKNASTLHEHTRQYFILKPTNTDTIEYSVEYEATFFSFKQKINSNRRMDWNCYNNSPYLCILQQHRDRHAKMVIIPVSAEIKFNGMQDQLMSIRFHSQSFYHWSTVVELIHFPIPSASASRLYAQIVFKYLHRMHSPDETIRNNHGSGWNWGGAD